MTDALMELIKLFSIFFYLFKNFFYSKQSFGITNI